MRHMLKRFAGPVLGAAFIFVMSVGARPAAGEPGSGDAGQAFGATALQLASDVKQKMIAASRPPLYASMIYCLAPKDHQEVGGLRFYTRLGAVGPLSSLPKKGLELKDRGAKHDETARELNDNFGAYITPMEYHYNIWGCDTQDYWFTFKSRDLVRNGSEVSRSITGHLRQETRGELDWEGDLRCAAFWWSLD